MFWSWTWNQRGDLVSESDIRECHQLGKQIAEFELKLDTFKKQRDVCEVIIVKLTDKIGSLLMRQRELVEGRAVKATGA